MTAIKDICIPIMGDIKGICIPIIYTIKGICIPIVSNIKDIYTYNIYYIGYIIHNTNNK